MVNIGFVGTGRMSSKMAKQMLIMIESGYKDISLHSVFSRNMEKGLSFRRKYGFSSSYDDYQSMLDDKELDVVYIASPHSEHYYHAKRAIDAGKAVFVEKPFTINEEQAREIFNIAESKGILAAEAMWTNYQPLRVKLENILLNNKVGDPKIFSASLCYPILEKERIMNVDLAGGALLDVGIYLLNMSYIVFGDVSEIKADYKKDRDVDIEESLLLQHKNGCVSHLTSAVDIMSDGKGIIYCTKGYIEVDNVNNIRRICVYDNYKNLIQKYSERDDKTGYEYEIYEFINTYQNKKTECESMPHYRSLNLLNLSDKIRKIMGIKYPEELS